MKTQVYLIPFTRSMPVSFSREALSMEYADILKEYDILASEDEYKEVYHYKKKDNVLVMEYYFLMMDLSNTSYLTLKRLSDSKIKDAELVYYSPKHFEYENDLEYRMIRLMEVYSESLEEFSDMSLSIRILEIED